MGLLWSWVFFLLSSGPVVNIVLVVWSLILAHLRNRLNVSVCDWSSSVVRRPACVVRRPSCVARALDKKNLKTT